jgi:tetratricopeptide (TPR) repeat protein
MMTHDAATGARAARALQRRSRALPIIEWIANAIGDRAEGADAWLATGLARYRRGDARALEALQRAVAHRASSDMLGRLGDAAGLLYYHHHRTEHQQAVAQAAIAYELVDRVCRSDVRANAYLNIAALLIDLGNTAMTEEVLDRARPLVPPTSRNHAYLRKFDAQIDKARDRPARARAVLREARAFAIRDGDDAAEFNVRMDLINVALRDRAFDEAAELLDASSLAADASANDRAVDAYNRGRLALGRGNARRAVALVEGALPTAPEAWVGYLEDVHGRALLQLGEATRGEQALLRAVKEAERKRDAMELDTFKSWLLAANREPFEDLFRFYMGRGQLPEALAVAQRATARSTLDGLLGDEPPPAAGIVAAGQHSETLRKLARALRASPTSIAPPIATVIERLRGNHVVTYFRARGELWAIAIAADSSLAARKIGDASALAARVAALRKNPEDLAIADELGAVLLPDALMPPPDHVLYIVADEPIANLPFAALRRGGAFVLDHQAVAYASSAAVLSAMRRTRLPIRALVLGDPMGDLPQAREEAREVAARLQVEPRLGADATGAAVLGDSQATLIHIAAHTELTLTGSALRLADGLLDANAVIDHGITAGAIVLLTCSSAAITSRDELAALAAAFVAAGARTVVASRWAVQDDIGRRFAKVFYEENGVNDPVRAVAIAQRRLASQGVAIAYWSTFAVIGGLP